MSTVGSHAFEIMEFVIPDPAGIIDWQKYISVRWKNVGFHRRATTYISVQLANENNVIETKVQLNTSISSHE